MLRLLVLFLLVLAGPAHAATVSWTPPPPDNAPTPEESCSRYGMCPPSKLDVVAAPGERNDISFDATPPSGRVVVRDAGAPLQATAPCELVENGAAVSCPAAGTTSVFGSDLDDRIVAPQASVSGGEGNDVLTGGNVQGGAGDDVIDGTDGPNALTGGPGADVVRGHAASDTIYDEPTAFAADTLLDGGAGEDVISFRDRAVPVEVDLSASPPVAGSGGEANVLAGIEGAYGGSADDRITGSPSSVSLPAGVPSLQGNGGDDRLVLRATGAGSAGGGPGDDVIIGGPGPDDLNGDDGADELRGGAGRDDLVGASGNDALDGGAGADTIEGNAGRDAIAGGPGNDSVDGGNGADRIATGSGNDYVGARDRRRDRIACGPGRDRGLADRGDVLTGCERVRRRR